MWNRGGESEGSPFETGWMRVRADTAEARPSGTFHLHWRARAESRFQPEVGFLLELFQVLFHQIEAEDAKLEVFGEVAEQRRVVAVLKLVEG